MKKNGLYILLIYILICMTGCGTKTSEANENNKNLSSGESQVSVLNPKPTEKENEKTESSVTPKPTQGVPKVTQIVDGKPTVLGNSQANLLALGYVCEYDGKLIYRDVNHENYLCMSNVDGTDKVILSEDFPRAIQVVDGYVYYIEDDNCKDTYNRIKRIALNGTEAEYLGEEKAGTMFVTEEGVYFNSQEWIGLMDFEGCMVRKIGEHTGNDFGWLCIYGDCIFASGIANGMRLDALKLDGSQVTQMLDGCLFPHIFDDVLYYVPGQGGICALSLVTGEEKNWKNISVDRSAVWNQSLVFCNATKIGKINLDTNLVNYIYPAEEGVDQIMFESYGIALDHLFFKEKRIDSGEVTFRCIDLITGVVSDVP